MYKQARFSLVNSFFLRYIMCLMCFLCMAKEIIVNNCGVDGKERKVPSGKKSERFTNHEKGSCGRCYIAGV
jgi:hypothetical protein